jgi:phosphate transport system protein
MQEVMRGDPDKVPTCMHYIHVAKNFERIADHATSIARTVHYIVSGQPATKAVLKAARKDEAHA